jgi:hypothetical protein
MFNSLDAIIESANKLIAVAVFLYILFSGGVGIILKTILTPLKIKITNTKMSKLDNELFDLQLLRIFHGINVESKKDAEMVQIAINKGILTRRDFRFLAFAPVIGKRKHSKLELVPLILMFFVVLTFALNLFSAIKETKYGYAILSEGTEKVLVSTKNVYDIKDNSYITKHACRKLPENTKPIVVKACSYLITDDPDSKEELSDAIHSNDMGTTIILTILGLMLLAAFSGYVFYSQYRKTNSIFCEFKDELNNESTDN